MTVASPARTIAELRRNTRRWSIIAFAILSGGAPLSFWLLSDFYGWFSLSSVTWVGLAGVSALAGLLYGRWGSRAVIARLEDGGVLTLLPEFGPELRIEVESAEFDRLMTSRKLSDMSMEARAPFQRSALEDVCLWLFQETREGEAFRAALLAAGSRASSGRVAG